MQATISTTDDVKAWLDNAPKRESIRERIAELTREERTLRQALKILNSRGPQTEEKQ